MPANDAPPPPAVPVQANAVIQSQEVAQAQEITLEVCLFLPYATCFPRTLLFWHFSFALFPPFISLTFVLLAFVTPLSFLPVCIFKFSSSLGFILACFKHVSFLMYSLVFVLFLRALIMSTSGPAQGEGLGGQASPHLLKNK